MLYSIPRLFVLLILMFAWLLVPVGVIVVIKAEAIFNFIGEIEFAEKYMPSGGTIAFIKIIGLVICFAAITWAMGGAESVKTVMKPFTL